MAQQSIDILKNYMTCEDPAVKTKYFNLLDSFWHKTNGDLLLRITDQETLIRFEFTGGKSIEVPKPTDPELGIVDISGLSAALESKVDKTPGKGLSTNDLTNALKEKLNSLQNYTHPSSHSMSMITGLQNALDDKVDKENGKSLTSNDFTDALLAKLDNIERSELHLANKLTQMSGQSANDLGMTGLFDRNALTDADIRGALDIVINSGSADIYNKEELLNAESNYFEFRNIQTDGNDKFEFDIIIDNGKKVNNYSSVNWQPFVFKRFADEKFSKCKEIEVFVSQDKNTWVTRNDWKALNFGSNEFYHFFGNGKPINPVTITTWRYAKFQFKNFELGNHSVYPDRLYLMQIGIRHTNEKFAQQYLKLRDYLQSEYHLGNYGAIKRVTGNYSLLGTDYTIASDENQHTHITLLPNVRDGKLYNFKIGRSISFNLDIYELVSNTVLLESGVTIDATSQYVTNGNFIIQYSKTNQKWYQVN